MSTLRLRQKEWARYNRSAPIIHYTKAILVLPAGAIIAAMVLVMTIAAMMVCSTTVVMCITTVVMCVTTAIIVPVMTTINYHARRTRMYYPNNTAAGAAGGPAMIAAIRGGIGR